MSDTSSESTPKRGGKVRFLLILSTMGIGFWWAISILVHTALFGLVYVATPDRKLEAQSSSSEFTMTISPDRVRDVVEEIRERKSDEFRDRVEEMAKIKEELDKLNAERLAQYNEIMKAETVNASERVEEAAKEALAAQEQALEAQK